MHGLDGHAPLHERERHAVEVGQLRVIVTFMLRETLEHQRVGHQYAYAVAPVQAVVALRHLVQCVYHHLHLCGVEAGNAGLLLAVGAGAVQALVYAFGPGHHLVVADAGIEQLGCKRGLIVALVVGPVAGPVLDGVGQEEHLAAGGSRHGLHRAVFKEGILKHTLLADAVEEVRLARRSGPYLRDVTVHAGERRQACLGADYLPLRIVHQRVGRHVAFDVAA